jgi:hypothetical protein
MGTEKRPPQIIFDKLVTLKTTLGPVLKAATKFPTINWCRIFQYEVAI